jgi:hypothetical protein
VSMNYGRFDSITCSRQRNFLIQFNVFREQNLVIVVHYLCGVILVMLTLTLPSIAKAARLSQLCYRSCVRLMILSVRCLHSYVNITALKYSVSSSSCENSEVSVNC